MFKNSNYLWRISYYLTYFISTYTVLTFYLLYVDFFKYRRLELAFYISLTLLMLSIVSLVIISKELSDTFNYVSLLGETTVKLIPETNDNYFKAQDWTIVTLLFPLLLLYPMIYYPVLTIALILLIQGLLYMYQTKRFGFCLSNQGLTLLGYEVVPVIPVGNNNNIQYIFRTSGSLQTMFFEPTGSIVKVVPLAKDSHIGIHL